MLFAMNFKIDSIRNWCHAQWPPIIKFEESCSQLALRIATLPILFLMTASTEVIYRLSHWTFHPIISPQEKKIEKTDGEILKEYENLLQHDIPWDQIDFSEAVKPQNLSKNRYSNILANEATRIRFNHSFDYYNGNWVLDQSAIACQGPLQKQIPTFWSMIEEQKVKTIVALCNDVEDNKMKCANYWKGIEKDSKILNPKDKQQIFHRRLKYGKNLWIDQFQIMGWPDHGVIQPEILAKLVKAVGQSHKEGPILVHCSAGVGRSGTFLTAWEAWKKKNPNVFEIVKSLRNPLTGRVGMVQQPEQYLLAYKAAQLLQS